MNKIWRIDSNYEASTTYSNNESKGFLLCKEYDQIKPDSFVLFSAQNYLIEIIIFVRKSHFIFTEELDNR